MTPAPDLVRLEFPGRWYGAPHGRWVGRALNACLFGELAKADPQAATALHQLDALKPLSTALLPGEPERLIVTGFGPCASPIAALAEQMPPRILLDGQWWVRTGDAVTETATWAELAAPLLAEDGAARARFRFLTPTSFHSQGRYVPFPLADLVLRSLLERWQRWSPVDLGEGAREAVATAVTTRFRGESMPVQMAGHIPGFTGWAELMLRRPPPAYAGLLPVLAGFAPFAGCGAKVGMGMGCVLTTLTNGPRAERAAIDQTTGDEPARTDPVPTNPDTP